MDIICPACSPPTNWATDKEYTDHLVSFHGTTSPDEAIKLERIKKKNSPVQLPPGIPDTAAPTPEFTQTMQEIERAKASQVTPSPTPAPQPLKVEPKPLILKYKFDGVCPKCNNPVRTIVNEFEGKLIANAYCMFCDETMAQIPVEKIPKTGQLIENINEEVKVTVAIEPEKSNKPKKGKK